MLTRLIDWYCQAIRFGMVVALALMVVLVLSCTPVALAPSDVAVPASFRPCVM